MAAGVMGAVSDFRPQQARVIAEQAIRLLAVADPQPLGHFLIEAREQRLPLISTARRFFRPALT